MCLQPGQLLPRHLSALGPAPAPCTRLHFSAVALGSGRQEQLLITFPSARRRRQRRRDSAWSLCMLPDAAFLLQPTRLLCNFYIHNFNVDDRD